MYIVMRKEERDTLSLNKRRKKLLQGQSLSHSHPNTSNLLGFDCLCFYRTYYLLTNLCTHMFISSLIHYFIYLLFLLFSFCLPLLCYKFHRQRTLFCSPINPKWIIRKKESSFKMLFHSPSTQVWGLWCFVQNTVRQEQWGSTKSTGKIVTQLLELTSPL